MEEFLGTVFALGFIGAIIFGLFKVGGCTIEMVNEELAKEKTQAKIETVVKTTVKRVSENVQTFETQINHAFDEGKEKLEQDVINLEEQLKQYEGAE